MTAGSRVKVAPPGPGPGPGPGLGPLALLLAVALPPLAVAAFCRPGVQFWDEARARCSDCSTCQPGHVVLRPCHVHRDALCGPVRDLRIDWSWLRPARPHAHDGSEPAAGSPRRRSRWHAEASRNSSSSSVSSWSGGEQGQAGRKHKHWRWSDSSSSSSSTTTISSSSSNSSSVSSRNSSSNSGGGGAKPHKHHKKHFHPHHHHHHHPKKLRPPESAAQLREAGPAAAAAGAAAAAAAAAAPGALAPAQSAQPAQPFSAAEAFVWDWQVAVLAFAVLGCVLFFAAAAAYGVRQVRRDAAARADAETLSATLSLMVPEMHNEISDCCQIDNCNSHQCLYMEQLLVRKLKDEPCEGKGNIYIYRGNQKSQ